MPDKIALPRSNNERNRFIEASPFSARLPILIGRAGQTVYRRLKNQIWANAPVKLGVMK